MIAPMIQLLGAGAVKPGLVKVVEEYRRQSGDDVGISFATAPAILKRLKDGEEFDVVIAPSAVLDELAAAGQVGAERVPLGRIGVGVLVRDGAPLPRMATVDEFKQALLGSESIVYNQASTGTYLDALFARLAIATQLAAKTTRYPDFAAVLDHVSKGKGREIGLGATTVIIENAGKGLTFAGPLPTEIQNYTAYSAALTTDGAGKETAREFFLYLASPPARSLLAEAGIT
jgi:molybdate transport system substrate-binding protein